VNFATADQARTAMAGRDALPALQRCQHPSFRRASPKLRCAYPAGRSGPLLKAEAVGAWFAYVPAPLIDHREAHFE